jgi:chromate transporter
MTWLGIAGSFLKVGLIGFGGGSALIPVIERELVRKQAALGEREYLNHTVIANITPGALPVKLGASCGWQLGGIPGSLAGAWAVAIPGVLLTVTGMALFQVLGPGALRSINAASVGISAFIVFLLGGYVRKAAGGNQRKVNLPICAGAFILTGGQELRSLIALLAGVDPGPALLNISTVNLMVLALFFIIIVETRSALWPLPPAVLAGGAYVLCSGTYGGTRGWDLPGRVCLILMALLCGAVWVSREKTARPGLGGTGKPAAGHRAAVLGVLMLLPALAGTLCAAAFIPIRDAAAFILRVCLSTLSSFGGGEAYISVADGFFVQGGFIPPEIFYARLVPLANALPGPILIKIAAGGAFVAGMAEGSLPGACLMAAAAAAAALGICGVLAVLALLFYDRLGNSRLAAGLTRYMPPVIAGMLLSTSCSILCESLRILGPGRYPWLSLGALAGWIGILFLGTRRRRVPDVVLVLLSAGAGLILAR